jgi:glycosyltransferase involved in cell wall biosynthesis
MSQPDESGTGRLAVVVPAHNAAATLGECLSALQRSARRPDEIILFDDGSTDATAEIARAAGVRVVHRGQSRQGARRRTKPRRGREHRCDRRLVDADVAVWARSPRPARSADRRRRGGGQLRMLR